MGEKEEEKKKRTMLWFWANRHARLNSPPFQEALHHCVTAALKHISVTLLPWLSTSKMKKVTSPTHHLSKRCGSDVTHYSTPHRRVDVLYYVKIWILKCNIQFVSVYLKYDQFKVTSDPQKSDQNTHTIIAATFNTIQCFKSVTTKGHTQTTDIYWMMTEFSGNDTLKGGHFWGVVSGWSCF